MEQEPVTRPMSIESAQLQQIVEGAILASNQPLTLKKMAGLFETESGESTVTNDELRAALTAIAENCSGRGFELKEVGSGWRFQVSQDVAPWVNRLWDEKPQKYSRALLETLALVAYRQPITRGDIEEIRGVAVSSHIIRTLVEREWVKVVGHRDVPGRPSLFATTRKFLDYFNLKSLDELPTLGELRDLEALAASLEPELALEGGSPNSKGAEEGSADDSDIPSDDQDGASVEELDESSASEHDEELGEELDEESLDINALDDLGDQVLSAECDYSEKSVSTEADIELPSIDDAVSDESEAQGVDAVDTGSLFEPVSDTGSPFAVEAIKAEEAEDESLLEAMPDEYLESVIASAADESLENKE